VKLEVVGIATISRMQMRCGYLQQNRMMSASSSAVMKSGLPGRSQQVSKLMPMSTLDACFHKTWRYVDHADVVCCLAFSANLAATALRQSPLTSQVVR
jgi:hypothetical protein